MLLESCTNSCQSVQPLLVLWNFYRIFVPSVPKFRLLNQPFKDVLLRPLQLCASISGPAGVQEWMILLAEQLGEGCVTLEEGLGSAFRSHSCLGQRQAEIKGSAWWGREGPAPCRSLCWLQGWAQSCWGGDPEETAVTCQQEGKWPHGRVVRAGGRGQRGNDLWHSGIYHEGFSLGGGFYKWHSNHTAFPRVLFKPLLIYIFKPAQWGGLLQPCKYSDHLALPGLALQRWSRGGAWLRYSGSDILPLGFFKCWYCRTALLYVDVLILNPLWDFGKWESLHGAGNRGELRD